MTDAVLMPVALAALVIAGLHYSIATVVDPLGKLASITAFVMAVASFIALFVTAF